MLEAAKRLIQLGRRGEEEGAKDQENGVKREKRRSLVELVMSPSRIFNGEKLVEEVGGDEERPESGEDELGGVRKFSSNTATGGRRRRRSSLVGRARSRKRGGTQNRSCPDLAALADLVDGRSDQDENTMSLQRGEEKGRQSWLLTKLKGRKEGEEGEEEEMVDTVDTNTANVFGRADVKTQLIDINFE